MEAPLVLLGGARALRLGAARGLEGEGLGVALARLIVDDALLLLVGLLALLGLAPRLLLVVVLAGHGCRPARPSRRGGLLVWLELPRGAGCGDGVHRAAWWDGRSTGQRPR
jgi:hypothetical protein